jgi:excisionase family DNA binding protein
MGSNTGKSPEDNRTFATRKEVAGHFGVSTKTVQQWIQKGKLHTQQPSGPGGRHFIPREELDER